MTSFLSREEKEREVYLGNFLALMSAIVRLILAHFRLLGAPTNTFRYYSIARFKSVSGILNIFIHRSLFMRLIIMLPSIVYRTT